MSENLEDLSNAELRAVGYAQLAVLKQQVDKMYSILDNIDNHDSGIACPEPETPVASAVHACFGFNLLDRINAYVKPDLKRTPDRVVTSLSEMQTLINSRADHLGAVYQLAGGLHKQTGIAIDISSRSNLTVYSDPDDRAIIDMSTSGPWAEWGGLCIRGRNSDNISVIGFRIQHTRGHGIWFGSDGLSDTAGSNIYIAGNVITDTCNSYGSGIVIRSGGLAGASGYVIECNEIYSLNQQNPNIGTNNRGEGIYAGDGTNPDLWVEDVTIRGNKIYDLGAEAIDIKRETRKASISYNEIYDIEVSSQGAIVISMDPNDSSGTYDARVNIFRNIIHDVTNRAFDGNAIVAAIGHTSIYENLIFNIEQEGIDVYADFNRGTDTCEIYNNIIWNAGMNGGELPIRVNVGNANRGPLDPATVTRRDNILQRGAEPNECVVTADYFRGLLTSAEGFHPA